MRRRLCFSSDGGEMLIRQTTNNYSYSNFSRCFVNDVTNDSTIKICVIVLAPEVPAVNYQAICSRGRLNPYTLLVYPSSGYFYCNKDWSDNGYNTNIPCVLGHKYYITLTKNTITIEDLNSGLSNSIFINSYAYTDATTLSIGVSYNGASRGGVLFESVEIENSAFHKKLVAGSVNGEYGFIDVLNGNMFYPSTNINPFIKAELDQE